MPEDASLDAFASSEADEANADAEEADAAETEESADADSAAEIEASADPGPTADADTENSDIEPAVSTYAWSPEGATCADCGESAEKRWRAEGQRDGDLVCADCKEW